MQPGFSLLLHTKQLKIRISRPINRDGRRSRRTIVHGNDRSYQEQSHEKNEHIELVLKNTGMSIKRTNVKRKKIT